MKQPLIVLTGPTAVGKTALSIRLAKAIGGEIVSADSMQVYRHMDIGSAKVTPGEMDGVPPVSYTHLHGNRTCEILQEHGHPQIQGI